MFWGQVDKTSVCPIKFDNITECKVVCIMPPPPKKDTPDFNHKTLKDLEKVLNIRN